VDLREYDLKPKYKVRYNYTMTDIQASLGITQLKKLKKFQKIRERYVKIYNKNLKKIPEIIIPNVKKNVKHAWHLYTILIKPDTLKIDRNKFIEAMRSENIGVNVHYIPVHLQPLYTKIFGFKRGDFPVTEYVYDRIVTLPLFPRMSKNDIKDVIFAIQKIIDYYKK
jgi:dTDP-4-amino-4,6-dideoxygalactose transaminase